MVEQTHEKHCLVAGKPINRLSGTTAGFASQQGSQTSSVILRATTTNTFIYHGKNKKIELFENSSHIMLRMQPEMRDAMEMNHFFSHLQKEALKTFRNMNITNKWALEYVFILISQNIWDHNHKLEQNTIRTISLSIQSWTDYPTSLEN